MNQPIQLPEAFRFAAYKGKMYFIHVPGAGWQLTTELDPAVAIVGFDQLTPPLRNDYFTFHKMMREKHIVQVKTVKEQIIQIRDQHIRKIEAIRNDSWLPRHRRGKVPRLEELDGAKINVSKYLHWTPRQMYWYKDLCRLERLAVQGIAHKARIGEKERQRYMDALACVFPEEWGRRKDDGAIDEECKDQADGQQRYRQKGFDPKQIFEDSDEYFFPGHTPAETSKLMSDIDENQDNRLKRLEEDPYKSLTMNEVECSILSISQHSRSKHSELPERRRGALQIRMPESPQSPTPVPSRR